MQKDVTVKIIHTQDRAEIYTVPAGSYLEDIAKKFLPSSGGYKAYYRGAVVSPEKWQEEDFILLPGEQVIFVPDFTGPLAVLAAWAITAVGEAVGSYIISAAISIGAGLLIQALTPKPKQKDIEVSSPTYSWDPHTNIQQGITIPRFYGKFKTFGNVIGAYVTPHETDRTKLHRYLLLSCGEGPVKDVTDIRVNNQPISNFPSVSTEIRRGILYQTAISSFDKIRRQYRPNIKVTNSGGAVEWEVPTDDYDDVEILLRFSVWYFHKSGDQDLYSCGVKIEARELPSGGWQTAYDDSVTNYGTSEFWVKFKLSDYISITRGKKYEIRVTKTSEDIDSQRARKEVTLDYVAEVANDALTYPGQVLVAVNGVVTEEFERIEDLSVVLEGKIVQQWNGTSWVLDWSDSPAWVALDVLTQPVIAGGLQEIWTSPTAYSDPSSQWLDEVKAYDNLVGTGAYDNVPGKQWSSWLELIPSAVVENCSKIRFNITQRVRSGQHTDAQIDLFYDGDWHTVYNTHSHPNNGWYEVVLPEVKDVSKARIKIKNVFLSPQNIYCYEFQFYHQVSEGYYIVEYEGLNPNYVNLDDLGDLADYCETQCPDGNGGTEDLVTFNGCFDEASNVWEALLKVCQIARCAIVWEGNTLGFVIDKPTERVGILAAGNILQGSFEEDFFPLVDRISEIECTYNDVTNNYERAVLPIYSPTLTTYGNKITFDLTGVTKKTEAWRFARYQLKHNEILHRRIKVQADVDCLSYRVGSRLGVQHDVPNWNALKEGSRGSGRVVSYLVGDPVDRIRLDYDLSLATIEEGYTYEILLRLQDDTLVLRTINSIEGEIVVVNHITEGIVKEGDLWAAGKQNLVTKDFRLLSRRRSSELEFELDLIEYNEELYADDQVDPKVPNINTTSSKSDHRIMLPAKLKDLKNRNPDVSINAPTVDIPTSTNLAWLNNTPSSGYITWSPDDPDEPILMNYKGASYEITEGSTDKKYVYWDASNPTEFQSTDTQTDAQGADRFPICLNDKGIADPAWGQRFVNTKKIMDNAITESGYNLTLGEVNIIYKGLEGNQWTQLQTISYTPEYEQSVLQITFSFILYNNGTGDHFVNIILENEASETVVYFNSIRVSPNEKDMPICYVKVKAIEWEADQGYLLLAQADDNTEHLYARERYLSVTELKK